MKKHNMSELYQMQSLPLSAKIRMTEYRIREWVDYYGEDGVYISFSGGKDSTVLLDIARKHYPKIEAVYVDTGLEYPEVRAFVQRQQSVTLLRPDRNFRQVITQYGYPLIGKEVAECVYGARRYLEKLEQWKKGAEGGSVIPNHSCMADLLGIDRRENKENEVYQSLRQGEIPRTELKAPVRYLILKGTYPHKENGVPTSEYSRRYNKERYQFLLEAPFEVSAHCCLIMKKAPLHRYTKKTGKMPMTAQMASESRLRTWNWLRNGCNGFNMKQPMSNPMSFWTEQDVLEYLYQNHIPIAEVYGAIVSDEGKGRTQKPSMELELFDLGKPVFRTTGCSRTGCVYCGFGCHREKSPNRWELTEKLSNPALIDYMMRGGAFNEKGLWTPDNRGLGFWFVLEWVNLHGNLRIILPHREKYLEQYGTRETEKHLTVSG